MALKRRVVALLLAQMTAGVALAQDVATTSEFGRVSGGEIELVTKGPRKLSGSLGMTMSKSKGYEATLGGTILQDRLWFFAAASALPEMQMPQSAAVAGAVDATMTAQLGDRNSLGASFSENRFAASTAAPFADPIPSSFLSLHYTGIASSNLFFSASFMRRSAGTDAFR